MSTQDLEQGVQLIDPKPNGVIAPPAENQNKYWSSPQLNGNSENYYRNILENQTNESLTEKPALFSIISENLAEKTSDLYSKLNLYLPELVDEQSLKSTSRFLHLFLVCLDYSISSFVVTPLVVGTWVTIWIIFDAYPHIFSPINSCLFGSTLVFVLTLVREDVPRVTGLGDKNCRSFVYEVVSRVYVYLFFFCGNLQWHSMWTLLDYYFEMDVPLVTGVTIISLLFVHCFRMVESLLAPPYCMGKDTNPSDVYTFPTWFRLNPKDNNILLYSLDCFFSVFVIGSLLVFVWRGAWTLIDIFLFPGEPIKSAWYSLIIGYIVVFTTFALQPVVKGIVKKLRGFLRLCIVDAYLIFSFTGTINVWRGIWDLLESYFLPNSPMLSAWMCHVGCFLLLILINSSNSVLVRGVYVDAEEEGSKCVDFPCYYLRLFFLARRKKQLLRQFQKKQVHNLKRRKSEADGHVETSTPKCKLEEPSV